MQTKKNTLDVLTIGVQAFGNVGRARINTPLNPTLYWEK